MIFRIVTKYGVTIDVQPFASSDFASMCASVRRNEGFFNENVYVPWESISFMAYGDPNTLPKENAPTTEKIQ